MKKQYTVAFWLTLTIAIALVISGFLVPPKGVIDGSVLTGVGELFLWPALAFGAKSLSEGHRAKIQHGETSIQIGNTNSED